LVRTFQVSKEERDILHTIRIRNDKRVSYRLLRECLLRCVIEARIEVAGRRGRRYKQVPDDLKERRGYWQLIEKTLARTVSRTRFGRGYGPVLRQTKERCDVLLKTFILFACPCFVS